MNTVSYNKANVSLFAECLAKGASADEYCKKRGIISPILRDDSCSFPAGKSHGSVWSPNTRYGGSTTSIYSSMSRATPNFSGFKGY